MDQEFQSTPTRPRDWSQPLERRVGIPDQYSIFIHSWRVLATFAVFLGHATRPDELFDTDLSLIGRATIPTFLMISGYFTALSFAHGGKFLKKLTKRYVTMWVIFVPASLIVLSIDFWLIANEALMLERDKFDPDMSVLRILLDLFNMLSFSGEYWSLDTKGQGVFSNEAYWTMDYIMGLSALTAAIYCLDGYRRWLVVLLIALLIGPTVWLLAPLWFAGVFAYEVHKRTLLHRGRTSVWHLRGHLRRAGLKISHLGLRTLAWTLIGFAVVGAYLFEQSGVGPDVYAFSKTIIPDSIRPHLGMAKRFLWQWLYVPWLFMLLVLTRIVLDSQAPRWAYRSAATLSRYALPLYAIHFTSIYLLVELIPGYLPRHDHFGPYVMIIGSLGLSLLYGWLVFRWIKPLADRTIMRAFD